MCVYGTGIHRGDFQTRHSKEHQIQTRCFTKTRLER